METIQNQVIKGKTRRQAVINQQEGNVFMVSFWINSEQVAYSKPGKVYKTYSGALKAANDWTNGGTK